MASRKDLTLLVRKSKEYKDNFIEFVAFLKKKNIFLNLIFLFLFFIFFPTQNKLWYQDIPIKKSFVRALPFANKEVKEVLASHGKELPILSAGGVYLIDLKQNSLLLSKNPDKHFYPASTTKIISAMVALDEFSKKEVITIPQLKSVGQVAGVQTGEQYYFNDLLYALLVQSGNDVASALADFYPGGYSAFVQKMNQKVDSFALKNTHLVNPSGIDAWNHFSSPHDLTLISQHALDNADFSKVVATKNYQISDLSDSHQIKLENINELLGDMEGMKGVKTGWTKLAGECLASLVEKDGKQFLGVVLQSQDRFADTRKMMAWAFDNFYYTSQID